MSVWILIWLCKTKLCWKGKLLSYGYKQYYGYKQFHRYKQFILIKTDNVYKDIAEDVETRFDTSNYGLDRPLPKEKLRR